MFDKIKDALGGDKGGDLSNLPLGGFEKYLDGVTYPIGIDDLTNLLRSNGAPDQVVDQVGKAADSGKVSFDSKEDVINSIVGGGLKDSIKNII